MQSDKSSSPVHVGNNQLMDTATPGKDRITNTDLESASLGHKKLTFDTSDIQKSLKHEEEDDDDALGTMPPVIEEGQEPPHPDVLPA